MNKSQLESFVGKEIVIYCCRYIYAGTVVAIDDFSIQLTKAGIVYDTGEHSDSKWAAFSELKYNVYPALQSIESFGKFKDIEKQEK